MSSSFQCPCESAVETQECFSLSLSAQSVTCYWWVLGVMVLLSAIASNIHSAYESIVGLVVRKSECYTRDEYELLSWWEIPCG